LPPLLKRVDGAEEKSKSMLPVKCTKNDADGVDQNLGCYFIIA
jgi:hypothetical protein